MPVPWTRWELCAIRKQPRHKKAQGEWLFKLCSSKMTIGNNKETERKCVSSRCLVCVLTTQQGTTVRSVPRSTMIVLGGLPMAAAESQIHARVSDRAVITDPSPCCRRSVNIDLNAWDVSVSTLGSVSVTTSSHLKIQPCSLSPPHMLTPSPFSSTFLIAMTSHPSVT